MTHIQLTKASKEQDPFVLYPHYVNDDVTTSTNREQDIIFTPFEVHGLNPSY
jgi:pantothenate synthetase